PPGLINRTSISSRCRNISTPALCGGGIHNALGRTPRLGNPSAAEQPATFVHHCRLTRSDPIFGPCKPDPVGLSSCGHSVCQRTNFNTDIALVFAQPIPLSDPHRFHCKRAAGADDDACLIRLDTNDVKRFLLAANVDPAPLPDGEMNNSGMLSKNAALKIDDL